MNFGRYLLYGCGQFGMMSLARFFFQWIVEYPKIAQVGTVPGKLPAEAISSFIGDSPEAALFGLATTVASIFVAFRFFDAITDPLAGMLGDWWVQKGRERRKLLWFSLALPPVGLCLVFAPDGAMPSSLRFALLSLGMLIFFVGYTFYAIPYWSLMDDYSSGDEQVRTILSNVLGAGLLGATLAGFVVSGILIENFGFANAAIMFAVPAMVLMTLPIFAQPPDMKVTAAKESEDPWAAFRGFVRAFKHPRFVAVLIIFSGSQMSLSVMTAAAPRIVGQLLDGTPGQVGLILGPFLVGALLSFPFVPWINRKFGWQKSIAYGSLGLGVVYIGTAFLGEPLIYSKMVTAIVVFSFGGPFVAILLGLEGEAITACARETGEQVTSVYFGVFNLAIKGMNAVAVYLTAMLAVRSAPELWGDWAVRGMGFLAGGLLAVGVVVYYFVPKRAPAGVVAPDEAKSQDEDEPKSRDEPKSELDGPNLAETAEGDD